MKRIGSTAILALVAVAIGSSPAAAWYHAGYAGRAYGGGGSWRAEGYRGGSASGSAGSWSATGFRGGTVSGGGGSWSGTGYRGGTASGGGGSWQAHGAYGGSAYGGAYHGTTPYGTTVYGTSTHYYGGTYATYHPPTVVNHYYDAGCSDCGGWSTAGAAAAGVAVGTAVGMSAARAASANAYAAGGAAAIGSIYGVLPAGCTFRPLLRVYECSGFWVQPAYGANGIYYRVVPAP